MARAKLETVFGQVLPRPRPTWGMLKLGLLYVGLPLLIVTGLIDVAAQFVFGVCTGLWCFV